jgi:hypothetical protein
LKISFLFFETMASRMATSYEPRAAQINEELALESSLDLTLMQHLRDENLGPWELHVCFDVDPLQAWYYCISPNSHTLVILLQIDLVYDDEPEIICEGCDET